MAGEIKMDEYAIEMLGITKSFGTLIANDGIDLRVKKGEIHALLGENGAGKSTLMSILFGMYTPDRGRILIQGEEKKIAGPRMATEYGIGMVHQHFQLVKNFTVLENIILGVETVHRGILHYEQAREKVSELSKKYGLNIEPDALVSEISVGMQQRVEIIKMLYRDNDILIFDEPTAVLTPQETEKLFKVMRNMRADGKAIIIITHKLNEVLAVSDRVAVLRKGKYIGSVETKDASQQSLSDMMVGHAVTLNLDRPECKERHERLRAEHLTVCDKDGVKKLDDVSFVAYGGEILGVAGVAGSGQKELLEAIAGLQKLEAGSEIHYTNSDGNDMLLNGMDPLDILRQHILLSFVPEDRFGMGLVGGMNITENIMLRSYRQGKGPFTDRRFPKGLAEKIAQELEVVTPDLNHTPIRRLSGGNVQKVLVGREIAFEPRVLMMAYAVRGLDIGTSYTIYNLLNVQKMNDVAVIYVGEDLDVLLELCDRILVMCGGKISGIVDARTTTKEEIGLMMTQLGGGQ